MRNNLTTPTAIDTRLAELHQAAATATARRTSILNTARRTQGKRNASDAEIIGSLVAASLTDTDYVSGNSPSVLLDGLAKANATLSNKDVEIRILNAEFTRRGGWTRFFLVPGGHIHSSMECSTCYPTTQFGWLPALSGLTEADAVTAHGTLLCSVCFPDAPVEWTIKAKPAGCAGKIPVAGTARCTGHTFYAECPECETRQIVTASGVLRKHKPSS
jgi:hypothetical protein